MNELIHLLQMIAYIDRWTLFLAGIAIGLWAGLLVGILAGAIMTRMERGK